MKIIDDNPNAPPPSPEVKQLVRKIMDKAYRDGTAFSTYRPLAPRSAIVSPTNFFSGPVMVVGQEGKP